MALPVQKLGTVYDERRAVIDPDRAKAYAAATNDDNPAYLSGRLAPLVFGVVPVWEAMSLAVMDVVPADALLMVVHGEQDMHFLEPLVPGATLVTRAEAYNIRVGSSGSRFAVKSTSRDADSDYVVLEQYATMFVRGMSDGESGGPDLPDHSFPEAVRSDEVGSFGVHVDKDQTYRYADASGDPMPIHLDENVARSVGLPGIIAHGLCTMAMTSQAVVKLAAGGDPARVRRLAVRFAKPVFPGNDVVTTIYEAGSANGGRAYAFEAESAGAQVIVNGRAEVSL